MNNVPKLKAGQVVEVKYSGKRTLCMVTYGYHDEDLALSGDEYFCPIRRFDENLGRGPNCEITKVYGRASNLYAYKLDVKNRELIWSRPTIKMTLAQIIQELGYEVEIVDCETV